MEEDIPMKIFTCLCLVSMSFIFCLTGGALAADITFSGTVNYVDYFDDTVSSAPLTSGVVTVLVTEEDTETQVLDTPVVNGAFSFIIDNAEEGFEPGNEITFLVTGSDEDGIGAMAPVYCQYITIGMFDIDSLYFEIYSQRLVDYIDDKYIPDDGTKGYTALLLGRAKYNTDPVVSVKLLDKYLGKDNTIYGAQDPILAADPTLFVAQICGLTPGNNALDLPDRVSLHLNSPGNATNTETVWLTSLGLEHSVASVATLKWGAAITGVLLTIDDSDQDVPVPSAYVKLLDSSDGFMDGYEITDADNGQFSLVAPISPIGEDLHLLLQGPQDGEYAWINSPFIDVPNNMTIETGEIEMITFDEIQGALAVFNEVYDLDIDEAQYSSIGLIGGSVDQLTCTEDQSCYWEDAGSVSVGVTDSSGAPIDHYVLYVSDNGLEQLDATVEDEGGFAILIMDEDAVFPLEVNFTAATTRTDVENFVLDHEVKARVYAFDSKDDGIITVAPLKVFFNVIDVDVELDDGGGGGGGCFITAASGE